METLHFFILQIQCIAILFTLWKMRQWYLELNKRQNLYYEGYQSLFKAYEANHIELMTLMDLHKDQHYKIAGLGKRLENTEQAYKDLNVIPNDNAEQIVNIFMALAKMRDKIINLENKLN